ICAPGRPNTVLTPWATSPLTIASPPVMEVMLVSLQCFVDDGVAQDADAVGLDLDDVPGLEVARRIEPCAGSGRRAGDDDVAGHQRRECRDVVEEITDAEDQP